MQKPHAYSAAAFLGLWLLLAGAAFGQEISSEPVGWIKLPLLANSDTLYGISLTRPAIFVGQVAHASGATIELCGSPGWQTNQLVAGAHYVRLGGCGLTDTHAGKTFQVVGNGSASLVLDLNGDCIDTVPPGAPVSVTPYWTLDTLFPRTDANVSFTPSSSPLAIQTQLLIPNYTGTGINLAASKSFYFIESGTNVGWRKTGEPIAKDYGSQILLPDGYLIIRNKNNAPTLPLRIAGNVVVDKSSFPLHTNLSTAQDNHLGLPSPLPVALGALGLAAGPFAATTNPLQIRDRLLLFDNATPAYNKTPNKSYFYLASGTFAGWRLAGAPLEQDHGTDPIPGCSALLIRKAPADGATSFWIYQPAF